MTDKQRRAKPEGVESRLVVKAAFELARSLSINRVIVQADELLDVHVVENFRDTEAIIWLTRKHGDELHTDRCEDAVIRIPDTNVSRMSQMKLGLFLAVLNRRVELNESIVCLSGVAGSERLDTLMVTNPRRDFPWFRKRNTEEVRRRIATQEFARIIDIALRLSAEGREGKPIGTIFVLGDLEELSPYLRQLVLNPCEGHPRRDRSIHREEFLETLREFAALDGAFILSNKGVVESAATYLDAPVRRAFLRPGLGARHAAGLAITAATSSIAVVVSASSGTVTVFHEGKTVFELERPQPRGSR